MVDMRQELNQRIYGEWTDIQGHLEFLYETVLSFRGRRLGVTIIELGVRTGNSTCAFLAGLELAHGALWSVDFRPPEVPAEWLKLDSWNFLQADDLSSEAGHWLPSRCDVLFIDTSHGKEHTLAELKLYGFRVRPGGLILCHDTQWAEPGRELDAPVGEVALALGEYCTEHGMGWTNRPGFYGLGVVRR